MFRKYPCLLAAVLLSAGVAQAAPRQQSGAAERLWVWNLGEQAAEVARDASGAAGVRVEAGETVEAPELLAASGPAVVSQGAEVLLLKTDGDFDPGALEVDLHGKVRRVKVGKKLQVRVTRPAWARELLGMTGHDAWLVAGQKVEAQIEADPDGRARLAVRLEKDSAVTVTIKDEAGTVLRSFSASSSVPVRWRADLGTEAAHLELRVDRGRAVAGLPEGDKGLRQMTAAAVICSASFSDNILYNYGESHTFSVSGCPANTCGELNIKRNGNWEFTGNWICTNSSGNATKGPWYWQDKASDETGEPVFIRWPNGDTTNDTYGIVDKNSAYTYLDSSTSGAPPTSYYGHGTDAQWGAGFDFGGQCYSYFQNLTTGYYWNPATDSYTTTNGFVPATTSRVNRWYVNWSTNFPSVYSHTSGHQYRWFTCCHDGNSGNCTSPITFTRP